MAYRSDRTADTTESIGSATGAAIDVASPSATNVGHGCRSPFGTYPECPLCGAGLFPEHAHFRCSGCGWRDSCCDWRA